MDMNSFISGIAKLLESALPTVVGGLITLSAFWLKEGLDQRKSAQEWFERTYIEEGVDRILYRLKLEILQLTHMLSTRQLADLRGGKEPSLGLERRPRHDSAEEFPIEALVRLEIVLGSIELTAVTSGVLDLASALAPLPASRRSPTLMQENSRYLQTVYNNMDLLRTALLTIRIKRKSDVYSIRKNEEILGIIRNLEQSGQTGLAQTSERDRRISEGQ
jgi:hypothetical protein